MKINTNLQSLIVQQNLTKSTRALSQTLECLSSGFKINHASDNAANYSISNNYSSKLSSLNIAMDNTAMGIDMVTTAQDTISLMQEKGERLMSLWTQAQNGTYGASSISAINKEANAIVQEINRLYSNAEYNRIRLFEPEKAGEWEDEVRENAEYNGINLLEGGTQLPDWAQEVKANAGAQIDNGSYGGFIADPKTYTDEQVSAMTSLSSVSESTSISSGTYKISSKAELKQMATMVNNGKITGGTFVLGENIDLEGEEWTAIGTLSKPFKGIFDGNGHIISNLKIDKETSDYQGLFGRTSGSTIKNVALIDADVKGRQCTGGLVGKAYSGSITNSYATGNVIGQNDTGGLVGSASDSITNSYATGSVKGQSMVGGLFGQINKSSGTLSIENVFASGEVSGNTKLGSLVGSIINTTKGTSFSTITITNAMSRSQGLDTIGFEGNSSGTAYSSGQMEDWLVNIAEINPSTTLQVGINGDTSTTLQVGINGDTSSQISFSMGISLDINIDDISNVSAYDTIKSFLDQLSEKATALGAVSNKLESAMESINVDIENLISARSTIKDADIAKVSSQYIKNQILQQASATLLATANQTPALALRLLGGIRQ